MNFKTFTFYWLIACMLGSVYAQTSNSAYKIAGKELIKKSTNTNKNQGPCDTLSRIIVQPFPTGVAWDGTNYWYVDSAKIYKINAAGTILNSFPNPADDTWLIRGGDICYDGSSLWYADEQTAQLFKINPSNGTVLKQFDLPSINEFDPNLFGLTWDGKYLWACAYDPAVLYKINPADGSVLKSLTPQDTVFSIEWINGSLYGVDVDETKIYQIDTTNATFLKSSPWCIPFSMGMAWNGTNIVGVSGPDDFLGTPTNGKRSIYFIKSALVSVKEYFSIDPSVSVFPNPAKDKLTVQISGNEVPNNLSICVFNILGEKVKEISLSSHSNTFQLNELVAGIYVYQVKSSTHTIKSGKVVVE